MNTQFIEQNVIIFVVLAVWELFWKGKALWRAAQKKRLNWFIALLVINSVGILPIIYLYFVDKKD